MLLIYTEQSSPRLQYIFQTLFGEILKIPYSTTQNAVEFIDYSGPKLNYSSHAFDNELFFAATPLLFETDIKEQRMESVTWEGIKLFFPTPHFTLPFDPFAVAFYLLSRYEEYVFRLDVDEYNRFLYTKSIAYKNGFLDIPVVNVIAHAIQDLLAKRFSQLPLAPSEFKFVPTFDLDIAFKYKARPLWRNLLGSARLLLRGKVSELKEKYRVLCRSAHDPYDIYEWLNNLLKAHQLPAIYFIPVGKYGHLDKNCSPNRNSYKQLIQHLKNTATVGIHPSYRSNFQYALLNNEVDTLAHICKQKSTQSRQHFLCLTLPNTYARLALAGITDDYSMGYSQTTGFRASTCSPFFFYNLPLEKTTSLKIHPLCLMDSTLMDYKHANHEEFARTFTHYCDVIAQYGGEFCPNFHNNRLAENTDFQHIFSELMAYAAEK